MRPRNPYSSRDFTEAPQVAQGVVSSLTRKRSAVATLRSQGWVVGQGLTAWMAGKLEGAKRGD
jgi:hypothetical protein